MIVVTWNINSIRARFEHLQHLITKYHPDIICLQEIKCMQDQFPCMLLHEFGYNVLINGQKSYNGVAILSNNSICKVNYDPDQECILARESVIQSRYLEVIINGIRFINIYAPNGNPINNTIKFNYKIEWTDVLYQHMADLMKQQECFLVMGDYNIVPKDEDCYDPQAFKNDAVTQPEVRNIWQKMISIGMVDTLRDSYVDSQYTYWGYRGRAWHQNKGLRLDHVLIPNRFKNLVRKIWVDKDIRALPKSSDHAPVIIELDLSS